MEKRLSVASFFAPQSLAWLIVFGWVLASCGTETTPTYTVATTVTPEGTGTITHTPTGSSHDEGTELSFTATASDGYLFSGWQGDLSGSSNPASLRLTKDVQVTALFEKKTYPLNVIVEQGGSVTEQVIQAKTEYEAGTVVRLTAIPDKGWEFVSWTGDAEGTEPTLDVTVTSAMTITATFERKTYPLTVMIEGEGTVTETVVQQKTDYEYGTLVYLKAIPEVGWAFTGWSGDATGSDTTVTILVDTARTVTARFERNPPFVSYAEQFSAINQTTGYVSNLNTFVNYIGLEEAKYIGDVDLNNKYAPENKDAVTYDFDGDGYLDLFFFGTDTKTGRDGYHGNGMYYFISDYYNQSKPYDYIKYDSMIEFAAGGIDLQDINGDGIVEILIYNTNIHQLYGKRLSAISKPIELGVVVLHVNEGFEITQEYEVGLPKSVHKGTSGDVDNDGDIDIINFPIGTMFTPNDILYKYPTTMLNDGNGNFLEELSITDEYIYLDYYHVESTLSNLFDIDGDGYLDLVFSRNLGNFYNRYEEFYDIIWGLFILWGDGSGYFSFDNGLNLNNKNELDITMTPLGSAFSDYDNDGDVDLIIMSTVEYVDYILTLFENTGDRRFKDVTVNKIEGYHMFNEEHAHTIDGEIMSIDKNKDGLYDLVPKGFTVGCCTMGSDPQFVDNLWWENVGGKYVRRVED